MALKIAWYWPDAQLFEKMKAPDFTVSPQRVFTEQAHVTIQQRGTGFHVCRVDDLAAHTEQDIAQLMRTLFEVVVQRFLELDAFYVEYALAIGAPENAKERLRQATAHWGKQIAKLK